MRAPAAAALVAAVVGWSCVALTPVLPQTAPRCAPNPAAVGGWQRSLLVPCLDVQGRLVAGSEMLHLVAHKGSLYAANGYWEDTRNPIYGGSSPRAGWAQILRLDRPDGAWQSDLELGPRYLRTELLKSIAFATDGRGQALPAPENLLVAATYDGGPRGRITFFVRDDASKTWRRSDLVIADVPPGEQRSVRALLVHRDAVTGVDRAFVSIGIVGIYSGVYDPAAPARIRWDARPESPRTATRILAIAEANGSLFFAAGMRIYRRIDGPVPRYTVVADMSDSREGRDDPATLSTVGGVRGLTAIPNPAGAGESLIYLWASGARSQGCMFRLDPDGNGGYVRKRERCLAPLVAQHLGRASIPYVLGAYNNVLPVHDPATGGLAYLIGLEAFVAERPVGPGERVPTAPNQRRATGGFYAGALYAIRSATGEYRIGEVDGPPSPARPTLVSLRAYALSPFPEDGGSAIYLAGYDADWFPASDTAWIYRADLATLLGRAR